MTTRHKLTLIFIILIVIANSGVAFLTTSRVNHVLLDEVQTKVRLDLNSARQAFVDYGSNMTAFLKGLSLDSALSGAFDQEGHAAGQAAFLASLLAPADLDLLSLIAPDGRVVFRANNPSAFGDSGSSNTLFKEALRRGDALSGVIALSPEQLSLEGKAALDRSGLKIEPGGKELQVGLALAAIVPVRASGGTKGYLYGARLLNQRNEIVDLIKNNVYQNQRYRGRDIGSTTIFFNDIRIATNVSLEGGSRAVGTRLSEEVANQVLRRGERFADRAFVVNEWYISAYEPLRDPAGRIVGALYVGMREAPFKHTQKLITGAFLLLMLATTAVMVSLVVLVIRALLGPVDRITDMARRFEAGEMTARTGMHGPGELGRLCAEIDRMADTVVQREAEIREFTQRQVSKSQKLASIGRLAAGIAHEINNPLASVLTFACLLREKSHLNPQDQKDLDLIIHETTRMREIVRRLLDFSRESPSEMGPLDLNEVIERTLKLVAGQKAFERVTLIKSLDRSISRVMGDNNQMQQVFLNIVLNAAEAMPDGGELHVRSFSAEERAAIEVSDTGHGIKPEDLSRIFEPFFTTKPAGKGTGLGLSISYGIVEKHGGTIEVNSQLGTGTTFVITLPCA